MGGEGNIGTRPKRPSWCRARPAALGQTPRLDLARTRGPQNGRMGAPARSPGAPTTPASPARVGSRILPSAASSDCKGGSHGLPNGPLRESCCACRGREAREWEWARWGHRGGTARAGRDWVWIERALRAARGGGAPHAHPQQQEDGFGRGRECNGSDEDEGVVGGLAEWNGSMEDSITIAKHQPVEHSAHCVLQAPAAFLRHLLLRLRHRGAQRVDAARS